MPRSAAPVHVVHTGPQSTLQGHGYDDIKPTYYEADIRPGQSVVMPGFTISIEAGRRPQQTGADGLRPSQPVVTVTPAEGDDHLMTITDQDFFPGHRQQQLQHYHHQQQPTSEHHPLAGIMRGQQQASQQVGAGRSLYRETDRPTDRSLEQDIDTRVAPQQHPMSAARHPGGVEYSDMQAPGPRSQPGEVVEQQRPRMDAREWAVHSEVVTGPERPAAVTETRPTIDNIQVLCCVSIQLPSFTVFLLEDKILFNPFNASCSKLLLFEGFGAILV